MSVTVVVTGFGPYCGIEYNPTSTLARSIGEQFPFIDSYVLPVSVSQVRRWVASWAKDMNDIVEQHDKQRPRQRWLFVHFGLHPNTTSFVIEEGAVNYAEFGACSDVNGVRLENVPVLNDKPLGQYARTGLNVAELRNKFLGDPVMNYHKGGNAVVPIPVEVSKYGGTYVSNYLYYLSLSWLQESQPSHCRCLYVHVPPFLSAAAYEAFAVRLLRYCLSE